MTTTDTIKCNSIATAHFLMSDIYLWLNIIKDLSGSRDGDLDADIRRCRSYAQSELEQKAVNLIATLIEMEASGQLNPPISLYSLYREIYEGAEGAIL